jgi:hypothetical protein
MRTRSEFRTFYEARYALDHFAREANWKQVLEENYRSPSDDLEKLEELFASRALLGLPAIDLPLFVDWIVDLLEEGVDLEADIERWFSELAEHHPEEPFVFAFWGDALRLVAALKYGSSPGKPDVPRLDAAIEKFSEAYRLQPDIKVFAARIWGLGMIASFAFGDTEEGQRRRDSLHTWAQEAKDYFREYGVEMPGDT